MGQLALEAATSRGVVCCQCGTAFWMEGSLYQRRQNDHRIFWCPNGHEQHFAGKTADQERAERLEAELRTVRNDLISQRQMREWAESRAKGANIAAGKAKAAVRRTLARVHAGVCPHCNRTFKQLAAHMESKHPDAAGRTK